MINHNIIMDPEPDQHTPTPFSDQAASDTAATPIIQQRGRRKARWKMYT